MRRKYLIDFQKRAAKVLWEAFQQGELTDPLDIDQLAEAGNEVAKAYQIGQAIMSLAVSMARSTVAITSPATNSSRYPSLTTVQGGLTIGGKI